MYILLLIFYSLNIFLVKQNSKKDNFIYILPLIIFIAIRYGIGTDYFSYNYIYNELTTSNIFSNGSEVGFNILMIMFKLIGLNYHIFSVILLFIILYLIVKWIHENTSNFRLSILIFYSMFFIVWVFSAYRQGLVMAIGTYYLFNKSKSPNLISKLFLIIILSTIHISAIYYIVLLILEKIDLSRNSHIKILILSTIFSLLFAAILPRIIEYIPFMANNFYLKNFDVSWSVFPFIIRMIFYVFLISNYDLFQKDNYLKKIFNIHMLGYPIYVSLKFSEIIAGRIFAFTFIFFILLVPYVFESAEIKFNKVWILITIFVCSIYFIKDLKAYESQVGFYGRRNLYTYQTVFNRDITAFHNRYTSKVMSYEMQDLLAKNAVVNDNFEELLFKGPVVIKEGNSYLIMDEYGEIKDDKKYKIKPEIYGNIIEVKENIDGAIFTKYVNALGQEQKSIDVLHYLPLYLENEIKDSYEFQEYSNPKPNELPTVTSRFFNTGIDSTHMWHFTDPFKHYSLEITYFNQKYYLLLDENKELIVDVLLLEPVVFNNNGLALINTPKADIYINKDGKVVWKNDK